MALHFSKKEFSQRKNKVLQSMQEQNMRMEVMMMGGEEIESETQPILN